MSFLLDDPAEPLLAELLSCVNLVGAQPLEPGFVVGDVLNKGHNHDRPLDVPAPGTLCSASFPPQSLPWMHGRMPGSLTGEGVACGAQLLQGLGCFSLLTCPRNVLLRSASVLPV